MDGIAARMICFDEIIPELLNLFDFWRESGLKLSPHKCEFGTTKIVYLGSAVTPKGTSPRGAKIEKFLGQIRMPNTVKQKKRLIGFVQFFFGFVFLILDKIVAI